MSLLPPPRKPWEGTTLEATMGLVCPAAAIIWSLTGCPVIDRSVQVKAFLKAGILSQDGTLRDSNARVPDSRTSGMAPHASAACTALAVASTPRMSRPPISLVVNRFLPSSNPLRTYHARFQSHPSA
jgi:hypothetical protein